MIIRQVCASRIEAEARWLYGLYCDTMRVHIEKTWGWDEAAQHRGFSTTLPATGFRIAVIDGKDVAAWFVEEHADHWWIKMLLVDPAMQNKGIGTRIINLLKAQSRRRRLSLKLAVMKVNRAKSFYTRLGFEVYEQDRDFFRMRWPCS